MERRALTTLVTCCKCGGRVRDWTPYRIQDQLIVTFSCCGISQTAEADFVITSIREGMRLVRPVE